MTINSIKWPTSSDKPCSSIPMGMRLFMKLSSTLPIKDFYWTGREISEIFTQGIPQRLRAISKRDFRHLPEKFYSIPILRKKFLLMMAEIWSQSRFLQKFLFCSCKEQRGSLSECQPVFSRTISQSFSKRKSLISKASLSNYIPILSRAESWTKASMTKDEVRLSYGQKLRSKTPKPL